jgi:hypothetical protein
VPVVIYTVLRLALFLLATAVLWWVGMRSWLAPLAGLFIAWALSYVLLGRFGTRAAAYVEERSARRAATRPTRADEDASYEDAIDDANRGERPV